MDSHDPEDRMVQLDRLFRDNEGVLYCARNPLIHRPEYQNKFGLLLLLVMDHARKAWAGCRPVADATGQGIRVVGSDDDARDLAEPVLLRDYVEQVILGQGARRDRKFSETYAECTEFLLAGRNLRYLLTEEFRRFCRTLPTDPAARSRVLRYVVDRDDAEYRDSVGPGLGTAPIDCIRRLLHGFLVLYMRIPYVTNFLRAVMCTGIFGNRAISSACPYVLPIIYIDRQGPYQPELTRGSGYFPGWLVNQFMLPCPGNSSDIVACMAYVRDMAGKSDRTRKDLAVLDGQAVGKKQASAQAHAQVFHTMVLQYLDVREMMSVAQELEFHTDNVKFLQFRTCVLAPVHATVQARPTAFRNVRVLTLIGCQVQDENATFIADLDCLSALHVERCNALRDEPLRAIDRRIRRLAADAQDSPGDSQARDDEDASEESSGFLVPVSPSYTGPSYVSLVHNDSMQVYLPGLSQTLTHLVLFHVSIDPRSYDTKDYESRVYERMTYLSVVDDCRPLDWFICRNLRVLCVSQMTDDFLASFGEEINAVQLCWKTSSMKFPLHVLPILLEKSGLVEHVHFLQADLDEQAFRVLLLENEDLEDFVRLHPYETFREMQRHVGDFDAVDMRGVDFFRLVHPVN